MKVKILCDGLYSDFNVPDRPNKVGAVMLLAGDEVDFPERYAKSIVSAGLAEPVIDVVYEDTDLLVAGILPLLVQKDATDAARLLAEELGLDLGGIKGSGRYGRVTLKDVRKAAGD